MFKSLLNGNVNLDSLILDVFIILGVVIAGALIVYFLWEAVNALVAKTKKHSSGIDDLNLDDLDRKSVKGVSEFSLDDTKEQEVVVLDEENLEEVDAQKAEEEETEIEDIRAKQDAENAERRAYLEARRQELLKRMKADEEEKEEAEETSDSEEENEDDEILSTPDEETVVAPEENTVAPEEVAEEENTDEVGFADIDEESEEVETVTLNVSENNEDDDKLEEERKALETEKERYSVMIKELEEAKRALLATQQASAPVQTSENPQPLSLEELKEKLANAEERLRSTEKEFKQCKKEYIPLRRVWVAYEKDEKKLRRKEALVAKQKVLLYGVNNYADIDKEKANKLAEDLDLLDGLKLSVKHCEEVMKDNEERYPLLEKMYNVLKLRNDELKNDIATYKAEIEKLEANSDEE